MSTSGMWGGRFKGSIQGMVLEYTESIEADRHFARQDIRCSKAHAAMLGRQQIITDQEAQSIISGLDAVEREIEDGSFSWSRDLEDVHMNIEHRLTEIVGPVGKKLHTGRSRNDQVATAFRLFVSERMQEWRRNLLRLIRVLGDKAEGHREVILPGYTHLQPAQPVSLAQHLLAYAQMFRRDVERIADCQDRVRVSPLGAAALAGTTYDLDPEYTAREIGFDRVFANSMDAVSDRDFVLEPLFAAGMIMTHLSRLCEELIIWANPNFGFVRLPDGFATGSSIMPQKKNPDVAELMRGKSGRVIGDLISLLTTMKALPLAYNRDLQEDKPGFLDADYTVSLSVAVMAEMIEATGFDEQRMYAAVRAGFLNATELADYLVGKGLPFRQAHHVTGRIVARAEEQNIGLEDMPLEQMQEHSPLIDDEVYAVLDYETAVARRESRGGTGPRAVSTQLQELRAWLDGQGDNGGGGSV
ncbi:argininosuccinate lyase [Desulfovermiculus halophilus]|uniref:argininosuccinate lyase n=1 Tax=Desulfovermiculus halophilus TaxID=339722 RepID=UPI000488D5AF|nr:argininosuccinate lyase [Desulfovermiculus halophilus]